MGYIYIYIIINGFVFLCMLVGGFKDLDYFPFHIWDVILPIDFHIFQG